MRIFKIFNDDKKTKVQITMSEALDVLSIHDIGTNTQERKAIFLKAKSFVSYKCEIFIEEGITYPDVEVTLTEVDGNAFSILAHVTKAMRKGGLNKSQITEYTDLAMKGDYDHLLRTTMEFVTVI